MIGYAMLLAGALTFGAAGGGELQLTPEQEAQALKIGKNLRCAVCQGMSVADSPSATARSQFHTVRELVAEGKTEQEIRDFFVSRYGDWALLEPKAEGVAWFAWAGPVIFLLLGLGVIGWVVARPGAASKKKKKAAGAETSETDEYYEDEAVQS